MVPEALLTPFLLATDEPGLLVSLFASTWLWVKVALGIGLVIFVHELGHFLAAKACGVKCEKFYVGFDPPMPAIGPFQLPRALAKFTYGETEYGIGILPLGGYVKMLGQDDDPRRSDIEAARVKKADGVNDADATSARLVKKDHDSVSGDLPPEPVAAGPGDEAVVLDPRSYPAQPVWQRMIIISAGVVMNVLTGVLFAAIAFYMGVSYQPAWIGDVTAGGPAWAAGIQPGGQVIAVNDEIDEKLSFEEMSGKIRITGLNDSATKVPVQVRYGDDVRTYNLATVPNPAMPELRMIGIASAAGPVLSTAMPAAPGTTAAAVLDELDGGGEIVSVDGDAVDQNPIAASTRLAAAFHRRPDEPVIVELRRLDGSTAGVTLPPQPAMSLGVRFGIGPITALVAGGPAEAAGVRVGDQIVAVGDDDVVDAYQMILDPPVDEPVTMTLLRGDAKSSERIEVTIPPDASRMDVSPESIHTGVLAVNSLGLAYEATAKIVEFIGEPPTGENALAIGDEIHEVKLTLTADQRTALAEQLLPETIERLVGGWDLSPETPLTLLNSFLQVMPAGVVANVSATRPPDDLVIQSELRTIADDRFWYDRGLLLTPLMAERKIESFSQAMVKGYEEGVKQLANIGTFLGMLVRGRVATKFVGGPLRIVKEAGIRAEQGIPTQLLFLTMLSMNLAIVNFLPIPALDGGHMLFLTAEAVRGKRVNEEWQQYLTAAGMIMLLLLMVFVFANDIWHW